MVGAAVAMSGMIGFVGLLVPHLVRLALGPGHRALLPRAALGGAALLVLADLVARTIVAPQELPIGVLTALVGAPFFLWLLLRQEGRLSP
jgi:iron complex transport system permease protein